MSRKHRGNKGVRKGNNKQIKPKGTKFQQLVRAYLAGNSGASIEDARAWARLNLNAGRGRRKGRGG